MTAVLLGDDRPRLDLSAVKVRGADGEYFLRAHIKERNGVPASTVADFLGTARPGREPTRRRRIVRGRLEAAELEKTFGTLTLPASGELTSQPIPLVGRSALHGPLACQSRWRSTPWDDESRPGLTSTPESPDR